MNNNTTKTLILIFAVLLCFSAVGSCFALYTLNAEPLSITITAAVPERELQSITANYTGGDIFVGQSYDPNKLSVDANYTTGEPETLESSQYTVEITSGTNTAAGTVTYTVTYQGQTDTFTITVLAVELVSITATYTGNKLEVGSNMPENALTVTAYFSNESSAVLDESDYQLTWNNQSTTPGDSSVSYTYEGITKTATFTPTFYYRYYVLGDFNNWTATETYGLKVNPSNSNERMLTGVPGYSGAGLKIVDALTSQYIYYGTKYNKTGSQGATSSSDDNIYLSYTDLYDFYFDTSKLSESNNSIYIARQNTTFTYTLTTHTFKNSSGTTLLTGNHNSDHSSTGCCTVCGKKILYFKPNSSWNSGGARFAAYFFNNTAGTNTWASMTDSNGDGIFEVIIPDGTWINVIFCRMNGSVSTNNWDNKWNQTGDLTLPTNSNNLYTKTSSTWDGDTSGTWSKK